MFREAFEEIANNILTRPHKLQEESDREQMSIVIGQLVSTLLLNKAEENLSEAEILIIGLPYVKDLLDYTNSTTEEKLERVQQLCTIARGLPSISAAEVPWNQLSIEEIVLDLIHTMHSTWQVQNRLSLLLDDYHEQFRHLPIEFLGWEQCKHYYHLLKSLFTKLEVKLDEKAMIQAYEIYVAERFFRFDLIFDADVVAEDGEAIVPSLGEILKYVVRCPQAVTGFSDVERDYFSNAERWMPDRLPQQLEESGFGGPRKIVFYARIFDNCFNICTRNEMVKILRSIDITE